MNMQNFPWDNSEIVQREYKKDNYMIMDNLLKREGDCIVLFSSNALYTPNDEETFKEVICNKNRYERKNIGRYLLITGRYKRIIFVRDLYKQWYITGISEKVTILINWQKN